MRRANILLIIIFAIFLISLAAGSFAETSVSTSYLVDYDITGFSTGDESSSASFNYSSAGSIIGDSVSSTSYNIFYGILAGATEVVATTTTTTTPPAGTSGTLSYSTSDNRVSGISVDPGANVTLKAFKNISLTAINFIANRTISGGAISVKKLDNASLVVAKPTEKTFEFLQIDKTNIADVALRTVKIRFSIAKSWITQNNVAEAQVALQRYDNGKWVKLPTIKILSDGINLYFESNSPGLSIFAITALAAGELPPTSTTVTGITTTTAPETTTTTTSGEATTTTTPKKGTQKNIFEMLADLLKGLLDALRKLIETIAGKK